MVVLCGHGVFVSLVPLMARKFYQEQSLFCKENCSFSFPIRHLSELSLCGHRLLTRRLYSLAKHPNPYKRLGAALTFNKARTSSFVCTSIVDTLCGWLWVACTGPSSSLAHFVMRFLVTCSAHEYLCLLQMNTEFRESKELVRDYTLEMMMNILQSLRVRYVV